MTVEELRQILENFNDDAIIRIESKHGGGMATALNHEWDGQKEYVVITDYPNEIHGAKNRGS